MARLNSCKLGLQLGLGGGSNEAVVGIDNGCHGLAVHRSRTCSGLRVRKTARVQGREETVEKLKGDLAGRAQVLSRFLGSAELAGKVETERRELYKTSDRAEAARADAYLAYVFCMIIMKDTSLNAADRIRAIQDFRKPVTGLAKDPNANLIEKLRAGSINVLGRTVKYTRWLDGTQECMNGASCASASLILHNQSDTGLYAAIRAGSNSIGSCSGNEIGASGLRLYDNNPGWSNNVTFEAARRLVPAAAKVPIGIKLENCSPARARKVDVAIAITVSAGGQSLDIPLSALDVPVE